MYPKPVATEADPSAPVEVQPRRGLALPGWLGGGSGRAMIPWIAVVVVVVVLLVLAFNTQGFMTVANGKAILLSASLVGVLAVGETVIMISGTLFTLSIAQLAAAGALIYLPALQWGLAAAIILSIIAVTAISMAQGVMIGRWGANPIITTIAVGSITEGADMTISGNRNIYPAGHNTSFQFTNDNLGGVSVSVWIFLGIAIIVGLIMARTRFGMQLYMMGDNRKAARAAGHPTARLVVGAFLIAGICAGVAGLMLAAISGQAEASLAGNNTYDAIAAALVGGTAVTGGRGSVARTVFGAVLIAAVTDLALERGYSEGAQLAVKGALVLLIVILVRIASGSGTRTA